MKKSKLLTMTLIMSTILISETCYAESETVVPEKMQPNTVIVYDDDLEYSIESGGKSQDDILVQEKEKIYATPGMRAVYDDNGNLRNVYYLVDEYYQLRKPTFTSKPGLLKNKTGVNAKGSGKYSYRDCVLNFKANKVVGTGQITFYGQPDQPDKKVFKGDHGNDLHVGDCATKWYVDDIPTGILVTAINKRNNVTMKFVKNDCGALPNAILDIFEDGSWSNKGICGLTVNHVRDSVDNGKIIHAYEK